MTDNEHALIQMLYGKTAETWIICSLSLGMRKEAAMKLMSEHWDAAVKEMQMVSVTLH